jgi:hypothetical protein
MLQKQRAMTAYYTGSWPRRKCQSLLSIAPRARTYHDFSKTALASSARCVRMCLLVGLAETASTHMRINLCRGQTLVPEQFLDTSQIRAAVQQVRRKAVPQCVR